MVDETVYESAEETVNHGANMVSESAEAAGGDAAEGDGGAGLAEGDGGAGLTHEDESDPTVPFEHGDPVGNFHLQMYADPPPPPPGYKAPPIALRGAGKGHKAPMMVLDGAGKGGKAAPVMLDGAGKGGKTAPVMRYFIHKGAKAPSVALDGVSTGSSSSASERSLASTHEKALESNQKAARAKTWRDCLNGYFWRMGCCLHILIMSRMLKLWTPLRKKKEKSSWVYHLLDQTMWPRTLSESLWNHWGNGWISLIGQILIRHFHQSLGDRHST